MSILNNLDALVVGAGFSGLYQLHSLRKLGYKTKVVDLAGGIGGIWWWNNFPGARVDSHVPTYEYGFDGLYKDFTWTERYPGQRELLKYFEYVDNKLDLSKDVVLNTGVTHAEFDTKASRWNVTLTTGETCDCKFLILCTGVVTKVFIPDFKGLDSYKGTIHHTGRWPQEGVDTAGKKVAVIGTGASGVQTIQEIGPVVSRLTILQRTPNSCFPMNQHTLSESEQKVARADSAYDQMYKEMPKRFAAFEYEFIDSNCMEDPPEKRRATFEQLYATGGFRPWLGTYKDILFNKESNDEAYAFWAEKTRKRIADPKKKDILAPLLENQPYSIGTKRPSLESTFYEVCNQDNVEVIDLNANPIETFTEAGIRMKNGEEFQFDVIVLATGYDALTGSFTGIDIVGTDGRNIAEKWKDGVKTYLGMAMANFPNLFMTYGPQAPTAFANAPPMSELQGNFISTVIAHVTSKSISTIEPTSLAEEVWHKKIIDLSSPSLFSGTKSWYNGSNIPGKKVEMAVYMGGVPAFTKELEASMEGAMENWVFDGYLKGDE